MEINHTTFVHTFLDQYTIFFLKNDYFKISASNVRRQFTSNAACLSDWASTKIDQMFGQKAIKLRDFPGSCAAIF